MNWFTASARELWGLFVDDGLLAVLALGWVTAAVVIARMVPGAAASSWAGGVFAAGLLVLLVASVVRAARKR